MDQKRQGEEKRQDIKEASVLFQVKRVQLLDTYKIVVRGINVMQYIRIPVY